MFFRRCLVFSFLLIFLSVSGCRSFAELAVAMIENDDAGAPPVEQKKRDVQRARGNEKAGSETKNDNKDARESRPSEDGFFRLILNDKTGSFSLFFLANPQSARYQSLFNSSDPSASYMTVFVDGIVYQLGNNKQFKTRLERVRGSPAIVHESSFLTVTQVFTPVKTLNSPVANGVMITLILKNKATQISSVGVRMLLDTDLGEGRKQVPFITNTQIITSELMLEGNAEERFWISRGKDVALMGSIISPVSEDEKGPDFVHMANWKRLNDSRWRLRYLKGRSFSSVPNSIRDSAVCYFFGPEMLEQNVEMTYTIYLTTEDVAWYNATAAIPAGTASILQPPQPPEIPVPVVPAVAPAPAAPPAPVEVTPVEPPPAPLISFEPRPSSDLPEGNLDIALIQAEAKAEAEYYYRRGVPEDPNVLFLVKLQEILDQFISGLIDLNEQDMINIEDAIEKIRNRD